MHDYLREHASAIYSYIQLKSRAAAEFVLQWLQLSVSVRLLAVPRQLYIVATMNRLAIHVKETNVKYIMTRNPS